MCFSSWSNIWFMLLNKSAKYEYFYDFLPPGSWTLLAVPVRFTRGRREGQRERRQKKDPKDLLWHSHTQTDNSDHPWAEAHPLQRRAYDHLIQQRPHLRQPRRGASRKPQRTLQGPAGGQGCEDEHKHTQTLAVSLNCPATCVKQIHSLLQQASSSLPTPVCNSIDCINPEEQQEHFLHSVRATEENAF